MTGRLAWVASVCQPSTLRMVICPEASSAQNSMAAVSGDGSTVWVLIRRFVDLCKQTRLGESRDLRVVSEPMSEVSAEASATARAAQDVTEAACEPHASTPARAEAPAEDIFFKIERLADLRKKGVLSEDEFAAKKAV